jgi:hypothetical protein
MAIGNFQSEGASRMRRIYDKNKKAVQIDDGTFFESLTDAGKFLGVSGCTVGKYARSGQLLKGHKIRTISRKDYLRMTTSPVIT